MNVWTIAGNLGKDAETRYTQSWKSVTCFSVAVEVRYGGEKTTMWVDCSLWGERGEKLAEYLLKGVKVCVSGQAGTREHNGKAYATLTVREVTLMGGGARAEERPARSESPARSQRQAQQDQDELDEDQIPF